MPVGIMIRVRSLKDAEVFATNYTHDVSLGGMFLKSLTPKPIGTIVSIEFPSPDPPGYTQILGKVVYQNTKTKDGLLTGMGIEFVKMEKGALPILQTFINGSWKQFFKLNDQPTEDAVVGAIETLINLIGLLMNFVHHSNSK